MASQKILVVDDDDNVREILEMYLKEENYQVLCAKNGEAALEIIADSRPDLIILDIMMPRMDGKEVLQKIREKKEIPVIFLSAKGEELDRVLGLELGADDYVTKPFSPREVVARVKTILKRTGGQVDKESSELMEFPELSINPKKRKVKSKGQVIDLSPKEYEILEHLARHPGQVFERERLYEQIWGLDSYGDLRSVDVHVNWLRKKLDLDYIKTVWGVGYKFEVDDHD
ncbi:MAG: response regulator transcription factor [Bacillota bacterium]